MVQVPQLRVLLLVEEEVLATGEDLTSRTRCHTVVLAGLGDPNRAPTLPVSGEHFQQARSQVTKRNRHVCSLQIWFCAKRRDGGEQRGNEHEQRNGDERVKSDAFLQVALVSKIRMSIFHQVPQKFQKSSINPFSTPMLPSMQHQAHLFEMQ